jgi:hypothetical protein
LTLKRIVVTLILILIGSCLVPLWLLAILGTKESAGFSVGIVVGSILGAGTWFYLSKTWDPVNLQPKGGAKKADMNTLWWVIPGGLILSRVLSTFAGDQVTNFFIGVAAVWVLLTFGYMVAQAWRHHPQS